MLATAFLVFVLTVVTVTSTEPEFRKISPQESDELKQKCGLRPKYDPDQDKVYGGRRAKPGQFPWAVQTASMHGGCGGTLITKRHVLTAGHCTHIRWCRSTIPSSSYTVYMASLKKRSGRRFRLRSLTSHPQWTSEASQRMGCKAGGDLAIYELDQDVPEHLIKSGKVGFGCLPPPNLEYGNHKLVAHGWGKTLNPSTEDDLMYAQMFPLDREECVRRAGNGPFPNDTVCVAEVNSNVCRGDSGGPLLQMGQKKPRRFALVGIVSFGTNCMSMKNDTQYGVDYKEYEGGVYTDVRQHLDWICEKTGACYSWK